MKLHILSDLHLSVAGMEHPATDADLVILAGDIARPAAACEWARGFGKPVLYVIGNHEFYGGNLADIPAQMRALCAGSQVRILDNDSVVIGGVRFIGSTLWSDFRIVGTGAVRDEAMAKAQRFAYDFQRVRTRAGDDAPIFTPADSAALFDANCGWLAEQLRQPFAGATVVITHHAPTPHSVHPRFAGSPLNGIFVSDAEQLVASSGAALWIHGHTHDSFDYRVGGTRVLCNPRGYRKDDKNENPQFDPQLVVSVD